MTGVNAANQQQPANIWAQMSYIPPRGPCSQKLSLLTTCPCFRFMIHPLKAPTSFDCDGCGHHASFHKMDNHQDDDTVRRRRLDEDHQTLSRETIMSFSDQQAVKAGLPPVRAGAQLPERRQIENRSHEHGENDLQILDETETELEARPVRKKKRTYGR